jgi:hypothetical protein
MHTGKKSRHENLQSKNIDLTDWKISREENSSRINETKEKLRSEVNTTQTQKNDLFIEIPIRCTADSQMSPPSFPHLSIGMKTRNYSWHTSTLKI